MTVEEDRRFRWALGEFATGVTVVTAKGASGELIGMTMSSFNSVSITPPLILFSVDRKAFSLSAMMEASGYVVNVLAKHQSDIANRFARAMSDKWSNVEHSPGHAEAPVISGALAHFECKPYAHYDGGDHVIFVGEVIRFSTHPQKPAPLVFFRGRYQNLTPAEEPSYEWPLPLHY